MNDLITPEIEKSASTALSIIDEAKSLIIVTKEDYELGQLCMAEIKKRIKELEEIRMSQTRPIDEAKKKIIDFFRVPLQKLEDAKNYLNKIMIKWVEEEEIRRKEEERKLQEAARRRAEEETLRMALEAERSGDKQEAEAILQEPIYIPPVKIISEVPKSKESHIREIWSAEGFDLMATVKAIYEGKAPLEAVKYNITFLNNQARAYKQALLIPGVKAIPRKIQL